METGAFHTSNLKVANVAFVIVASWTQTFLLGNVRVGFAFTVSVPHFIFLLLFYFFFLLIYLFFYVPFISLKRSVPKISLKRNFVRPFSFIFPFLPCCLSFFLILLIEEYAVFVYLRMLNILSV